MLTPINAFDLIILEKLRLERFSKSLGDKNGYKFSVRKGQLCMEAVAPFWIDVAIKGFPIFMEVAYNILGVESIKLVYANNKIADYYRGNSVKCANNFMVATLERDGVTEVNGVQTASLATSPGQNSDYISLDQLRAMAVEISGENEEFIAWMEQNNVTIPTKFISGIPRYQTKAIFKAATEWNNSKIQTAMSRYLGIGVMNTTPMQERENISNGVSDSSPTSGLKLLRTPSGFKPIKSGKDKYIKTVKALIAALPSEKVQEYQRHILDQNEMGTAFVTRLSKQFDEKDAFAKLIEAFQEEAGANVSAAA